MQWSRSRLGQLPPPPPPRPPPAAERARDEPGQQEDSLARRVERAASVCAAMRGWMADGRAVHRGHVFHAVNRLAAAYGFRPVHILSVCVPSVPKPAWPHPLPEELAFFP
ncbi:unnamed protein product [Urochloa humidicola]